MWQSFNVDWLKNSVRIIQPERSLLINNEEGLELDNVPFMFQRYKGFHNQSIITGKGVTEGSRNDTLFRWINSVKGESSDKINLSRSINQMFFDPPLPEQECLSTTRDLGESKAEEEDGEDSNNKNSIISESMGLT